MYFPFQLPIFGQGSNFRVIGLKQHGKAKLRSRNLLSVSQLLQQCNLTVMTLEIQEFIIGGSILLIIAYSGRLPGPKWLSIFNSGRKDQLYKKKEPDPNRGSNQL